MLHVTKNDIFPNANSLTVGYGCLAPPSTQ